MTKHKVRVAIVEDHLENQIQIKKMVNETKSFTVDFVVSSYEELVKIISTGDYSPAIILLDMTLETEKDGISVLDFYNNRAIKEANRIKKNMAHDIKPPKIVILSQEGNNYMFKATEKRGSNGYILKSALFKNDSDFLEAVLTTIQKSDSFIKITNDSVLTKPNIKINNQDKDILRMLAEGKRNKEIANKLDKREAYVAMRLLLLKKRIEAESNIDLIRKASELSLI